MDANQSQPRPMVRPLVRPNQPIRPTQGVRPPMVRPLARPPMMRPPNQLPGRPAPMPMARPATPQQQVAPVQPGPSPIPPMPVSNPVTNIPAQPPQNIPTLNHQMSNLNMQSEADKVHSSRAKRVYANQPPANSYQANNPGFPQTQQPPVQNFQQPPAQPIVPTQMPANPAFQAPTRQPSFAPPPYQPQVPGVPTGPPGTPGMKQAGKHRIDPDQVPSPVAVHEADQAEALTGPYHTMSKTVPPLASVHFRAVDDGICSPRFLRSTLYQFPTNDTLLNTSHLPFGAVIQPLADLSHEETPVPVVDFGEKGPIRCERCKGYVNPFFQFIHGGRKFVCNLCQFESDTPEHYFSNLDMNGRRMDVYQRPELLYGACDFEVQKEYCSRPPRPASYLFAIDVSFPAIQSGMLNICMSAIKYFLYESGSGLPEGCKVSFMTFDRSIHFYNLQPTLESPQMMIVSDLQEPLVPMQDIFVDPKESKNIIIELLNSIPSMFANNKMNDAVTGAACQMAYEALKDFGGKLSLFHTSLPINGPGALKNREDVAILGTEKERSLYEPQEYFWPKLGQLFATHGIGVDTYFFRNGYVDVATVGTLSAISGGDTYLYNSFSPEKDAARFGNDLQSCLTRTFGYDAIFRVRVSAGLKVHEYLGNFYMQNATDVDMGGIDSLKAFAVLFKHDGKLDEKFDSYVQSALLYTTATGKRRVRVLNFCCQNTSQLSNLFRCAEMDTSMNVIARCSVQQMLLSPLKAVRDSLSNRCVKLLSSYRLHCAAASSPGQLILPEAFKLYPLYNLSLLKCRALRMGKVVATDLRVHTMRLLNSLGVAETSLYFYPKMYNLNQMDATIGEIEERGIMKLPPVMRMSAERMSPDGIYLIENGRRMFLYVGGQVPPQVLQQVFGVDQLNRITQFPKLGNQINQQISSVIAFLSSKRPRFMGLQIVRFGMDGVHEQRVNNLMMEDENLDNMSYVDYLCIIHKNIQTEILNQRR